MHLKFLSSTNIGQIWKSNFNFLQQHYTVHLLLPFSSNAGRKLFVTWLLPWRQWTIGAGRLQTRPRSAWWNSTRSVGKGYPLHVNKRRRKEEMMCNSGNLNLTARSYTFFFNFDLISGYINHLCDKERDHVMFVHAQEYPITPNDTYPRKYIQNTVKFRK